MPRTGEAGAGDSRCSRPYTAALPNGRQREPMTWRTTTPLLLSLLVVLAAGCGGTSLEIEEPGPPVGKPVLPDLAPAPALDIRMSHEGGRWLIRFSSILV